MKYSVIVVDDEKLIARNIARNIEAVNSSFEVKEILNCGTDALKYIRENMPNVVFTDIRMPEMDGLELARAIADEFPFIKCVIVSGYNDFSYAQNAITYQVTQYLLKPINKEELAECLLKLENSFRVQRPNLENINDDTKKTWNGEEIVALVKEYIHKNYSSQIDLTNISNNFGFSSAYLSKVFSKYAGISPSKYLKNYRIMIAKQLLNNPDVPISAISTQTGFLDQFYFSKTFKSATGYSPTEYRNLRSSNDTIELNKQE